jgi:hypothetical protein
MKTTNYFDAFISVSEDSPAKRGEIPPLKNGEKTIAGLQYDLIKSNPYLYTSDEVVFAVYAQRNIIGKGDMETERERFFSKGQPCLRSSSLVKRYGWSVHSNNEGRVAIYPMESKEYLMYSGDKSLKQLKGMKSKK